MNRPPKTMPPLTKPAIAMSAVEARKRTAHTATVSIYRINVKTLNDGLI